MFHRKYATERWYNFPPHLIGVSALTCKIGNMEITPLQLNVVCCFANRYRKRVKLVTWS